MSVTEDNQNHVNKSVIYNKKRKEETNSMMEDNFRTIHANITSAVNPPPPPLPGIFIFDMPNQQKNICTNVEIKRNQSNEMFLNHSNEISSSTSSSVQFVKTMPSSPSVSDNPYLSSSYLQPTSSHQSMFSDISNSIPSPDSGSDMFQSLEPTTINTFDESFESSETKVYHQLHTIVPNEFKLSEEPSLYHEMTPFSLTSSKLPKEYLTSNSFEQLNAINFVEDNLEEKKTFQELKPLIPHYYDKSQYASSKLYQQLCQSPTKEISTKYQHKDVNKYQQLRPTTVIDIEQSNNKKNLQTIELPFSNNSKKCHPVNNIDKDFRKIQCPSQKAVVNKPELQIVHSTSQATTRMKISSNLQTSNGTGSHIGFNEGKPKVYLELRNPTIRSQLLTKSSIHEAKYLCTFPKYGKSNEPTSLPTSLPNEVRLQKSPDFKLPGPSEFKLPQQNSANKTKLPKILGHNEYSSPNLVFGTKQHERNSDLPFSTQSALQQPLSSTIINHNTSYNAVKNKVALSLPKTPLCYGDPGVSSKVSYYANQTTYVSSNADPSLNEELSTTAGKERENPSSSQTPNLNQLHGHSKLREELLKPKMAVKNLDEIASKKLIDRSTNPNESYSKFVSGKSKRNMKIVDNCIDSESITHIPSDPIPTKFKILEPFKDPVAMESPGEKIKSISKRHTECGKTLNIPSISADVKAQMFIYEKPQINNVDSSENPNSIKEDSLEGLLGTQIKEGQDSTPSFAKLDKNLTLGDNQCCLKNLLSTECKPKNMLNSCKKDDDCASFEMGLVDKIPSCESVTDQSCKLYVQDKYVVGRSGIKPDSVHNESKSEIYDLKRNRDIHNEINSEVHDLKRNRDICKNEVNNSSVATNLVKNSEESNNGVSSNGENPESHKYENHCVSHCQIESTNSAKCMKSEKNSVITKTEVKNGMVVKVKRKYTRRIVPENERRIHTKRKASWGIKDVVAREKRRYIKRNKFKIVVTENEGSNKYNFNKKNYEGSGNEILSNVVQGRKDFLPEEVKKLNNDYDISFPQCVTTHREKRKYTRRKFKNKNLQIEIMENNRVKRKYTRRNINNLIQCSRELKEKSINIQHKFVDPLEEGIITDDEGEPLFLGYDIADDEEETVLGFEVYSEEETDDNESQGDVDGMTVECDPRSLLASDNVDTCSLCSKSFNSRAELARHVQKHPAERAHHSHSYVCSLCFRGFATELQLNKHIIWTHKGGKKYRCPVCPKKFTTKVYAKRHAETAHKAEEISEEKTISETSAQEKAIPHSIAESSDNDHTCSLCSKSFNSLAELARHVQKHPAERDHHSYSYFCSLCFRGFATQLQLNKHTIWTHKGGKKYRCPVCPKKFTTKVYAKRHAETAHKAEEISEEKTISETSNQEKAIPHSIAESSDNVHTCSLCSKSFNSRAELAQHVQKHPAERVHHSHSYVCSVCFRGFATQLQLNKHIIWTHKGGKKYRCPVCPKKFTTKVYAKRHAETAHKAEEIISEEKTISETSDQEKEVPHPIAQTGDNVHTCSLCCKSFNSRAELAQHVQKHPAERDHHSHSYVCSVCFRGFATQFQLNKHIKWTHKGGKKYRCSVCSKRFTTKAYAKRHSQFAHTAEEINTSAKTVVKELMIKLYPLTNQKHEETKITSETSKESINELQLDEDLNQTNMGYKMYKCAVCPKRFTSKAYARKHAEYAHKVEQINATKPAQREAEVTLNLVAVQKSEGTRLTLESVPHENVRKLQLDKDTNWTHMGYKMHKCTVCPKRFTSKAYARKHAETAHKSIETKATDKTIPVKEIVINSVAVQKSEENKTIAEVVRKEIDQRIVETCHQENKIKLNYESDSLKKMILSTETSPVENEKIKITENLHTEEGNKVSPEIDCKAEEMTVSTFDSGDSTELFNTENPLNENEDKVHKKTLHQCEMCLRYFQKFANLQRHKLSHINGNESQAFPCAYCNEQFTSRDSLHAHWKVHSEKKLYTCDICNSNFTAPNSLKRHKILHSGEKLFRCEICKKSFSLLSTLKTHLLIHTGGRRFQCKLCGKKFNRKDVLNAHQLVHTGEKKFECDTCFEKFRWKHALKSHKLIHHSSEKPYCCQVCGKRFSHPDSFKKHALVHSARRFFCQLCLKAFSRLSTLKAHVTTHTDLKPFNCDKCHRAFRTKSYLKNHFLVHIKEKPWLCKFCNKTYKNRAQLQRHKRVVHCKAFYNRFLPSLTEIYKTDENLMVDVQTDNNQVGGEETAESDYDPSQHFISLPVECTLKKMEENIVPPSVL